MNDHDDAGHKAPQAWLDALEESEADLAAGRVVSSEGFLQRLDESIARMRAKEQAGKPDQRKAAHHR